MMKTEIYIATHKAYDFPKIDGYIPIHVGKALTDLDLGIIGDNTGDHVSELNSNFCELTALYWMWKNSDADILGLVHYRRYFCEDDKNILDIAQYKKLLNNTIILSKKESFLKREKKMFGIKFLEYYSVQEQYDLVHSDKDWISLRDVILIRCPVYSSAFEKISNKKNGISLYNMIIGDSRIIRKYAEWLFNILFELSKNIDVSNYDSYQRRIFGFMSERLLNVFFYHHRHEYNIIYKSVTPVE